MRLQFHPPAESRYATIKLECLAISYTLKKSDYFIRGQPNVTVTVTVTDHRLLLGIFAKSLQAIDNPSLMCLRERMGPYSFALQWIEGKSHVLADALSRAPFFKPDENTDNPIVLTCMCSALTKQTVWGTTDPFHRKAVNHIKHNKLPTQELSLYKGIRDYLGVTNPHL